MHPAPPVIGKNGVGASPPIFCERATFVPSKNSAVSRWSFHSMQTGPRDGASSGRSTDSSLLEAGRTSHRHCTVNVSAIPSTS